MGFMKEAPVNLEVDVMEGDGCRVTKGVVYQQRNGQCRQLGYFYVGRWETEPNAFMRLDLPTFTNYCDACGLTVKEVKPDPQVETIKPPEWGVLFKDNCVSLCQTREVAEDRKQVWGVGTRVVRIDWGAK